MHIQLMGCLGLTAHLGLRGDQAEGLFSFFRNGVNNDAERWISPRFKQQLLKRGYQRAQINEITRSGSRLSN